VWLPLTVAAAAAALIFVMTVTNRHDKRCDSIVDAKNDSTNILPKPVPETGKTEIKSSCEKTAERMNISAKETVKTAKKHTDKTNESKTDKRDLPVETVENKNRASIAENVQIKPIASITVPVKTIKKEKTVIAYRQNCRQPSVFKTANSMASAVRKFATDVDDAKQSIAQKLDGFKLPNILTRLSFDRGIDHEIDEWVKNNPDVPFSVYVDYSEDDKMTKIYDENGVLLKVVFFTNKSLKYRNNKTYRASNN
jgi:hypothetical protein